MRVAALVVAFLSIGVNAAYADASDGDWCNEVDGARLRIDGPMIALPAGQTIIGNYERHTFSYVAPPGDLEAGASIQFVMRSENQMRRIREPNVMPEHEDLWRRCQPIS